MTFLSSFHRFKPDVSSSSAKTSPGGDGEVSVQSLKRKTTSFTVGSELWGMVTAVREFGLFVTFPNKESGLVYWNEICWPCEKTTYRKGEEVAVKVIGFDPNRGLALSIKRARRREFFTDFCKKNKVGDIVSGHVASIMDYGLFIGLAPGIDGLAHIKNQTEEDAFVGLYVGDKLCVRIVSIDESTMRIGLTTDLMPRGQGRGND